MIYLILMPAIIAGFSWGLTSLIKQKFFYKTFVVIMVAFTILSAFALNASASSRYEVYDAHSSIIEKYQIINLKKIYENDKIFYEVSYIDENKKEQSIKEEYPYILLFETSEVDEPTLVIEETEYDSVSSTNWFWYLPIPKSNIKTETIKIPKDYKVSEVKVK